MLKVKITTVPERYQANLAAHQKSERAKQQSEIVAQRQRTETGQFIASQKPDKTVD
jgi:hypothetical protein